MSGSATLFGASDSVLSAAGQASLRADSKWFEVGLVAAPDSVPGESGLFAHKVQYTAPLLIVPVTPPIDLGDESTATFYKVST
jgi:hypothetical protein